MNKLPLLAILMLVLGSIGQMGMLYFFLEAQFLNAFICHAFASLLFPWPIFALISNRYHKHKLILVLFLVLCFFIPLVAGFGLLLSVALGSYYAEPIKKNNFTTINIQHIPKGIIKHIAYVERMSSNIRSILEYSNEPEERIRAVLATRKISDQEAVPILQIALLDPTDEIRLLAYSMLNAKEKKLSAAIQANLNELSAANSLSVQEKATKNHFVAECYWELSFLGLEQGEAKAHVLRSADRYVTEALTVFVKAAELYFLKARIALELEQYSDAKQHFKKAKKCGMPAEKLAPYKAELAFAERRFDEVRHFMQQAKNSNEKNTLTDMVKQWQ